MDLSFIEGYVFAQISTWSGSVDGFVLRLQPPEAELGSGEEIP